MMPIIAFIDGKRPYNTGICKCLHFVHVRTGLNQSNNAHIKEKVTHYSKLLRIQQGNTLL